jgi:chitin disaccharide deacetylase
MRIIVNADDLGATPEINEAVFAMMSKGLVTSATIMANGPAVGEALRGVPKFPGCSFGIHLNLTQYAPLSGTEGFGSLLPEGVLVRGMERAPLGPRLAAAVYAEWCAQVAFLLESGVALSHFDSHHHVHNRPLLLPVLKALMLKFRVRRVRISKNVYSPGLPATWLKRAQKQAYNTALRHVPEVMTTSGFTEFQSFYDIRRARLPINHPTLEIMVHPGADSEAYRRETALIVDGVYESLCPGARLINYAQL